MRFVASIVASALVPAAVQAASAAPAYISCPFKDGWGNPFEVQITADEANGTVTLYMPSTGNIQTRRAVFGPREVVIADRDITYRIDRTTLVIERSIARFDQIDRVECKLEKVPQRAF